MFPITTNLCINYDKHIYQNMKKKSGQGALLMGGILGVFLGGRSVGSGNWTAEANCLHIFTNKETATFTNNELFIDVASSPHFPHLTR